MSVWRRIFTPGVISRILRRDTVHRSINNYAFYNKNITSKVTNLSPINFNSIRCKSKKKQQDLEDEANDDIDDSSLSKDSKVVKFNCTSMRIDAILKLALAVSRNKVEQMFYDSKIRVNGKKILKKSASVKIGDELDVIKMVSPNNSGHLYVARVEILDVTPKEENIGITARRFKNLLIENYEADPHKSAAENDV